MAQQLGFAMDATYVHSLRMAEHAMQLALTTFSNRPAVFFFESVKLVAVGCRGGRGVGKRRGSQKVLRALKGGNCEKSKNIIET